MVLKKFFISLSFVVFLHSIYLHAQIAPNTYWIEFTDKNNSPYSISNPEEFLSQRSIERRLKQGIPIGEEDLPVNKTYLDSLQNLGVKIHNVSKWFNGVAIITNDTVLLDTIHSISFIKNPIKTTATFTSSLKEKPKYKNAVAPPPDPSDKQLSMLNIPMLHQMGYTGNGVLIGILDAGFQNAGRIESLSHLWEQNKILIVKDFVKDGEDILENHSHGTKVGSIIGANWPDTLLGASPSSDFALIRTEKGSSEYLVEEYNWVSGAEFADSLGVDIINSSLGYSEFDDSTQNHLYEDLNGYTTPITKGALIAARKGILIVNSAGNSGDDPWYYITAPGDADSILTIGAVNFEKEITNFSSRGPTADGRIKPDVCAVGLVTRSQSDVGAINTCSGTSCSAPLITGLAACLLSANPGVSAEDIRHAIIQSSSQNSNPDNDYGYGIPDGQAM